MATISNSSLETFLFCPRKYENRYELGLVRGGPEPDYLLFGTYFHGLLQAHYTGGAAPQPPVGMSLPLAAEVEAMFEAYKSAYPVEPFEVLECERKFSVDVGSHKIIGRIDSLVRDKQSKRLQILETKTEKHGSKRNLPQTWIARHQGSLYTYCASQLYQESIDTILLNVVTRGTAKGQIGPAFRRDTLHRTPQQIAEALKTFKWVADNIDQGVFVQATSNTCVSDRGFLCEYYSKCHLGDEAGLIQIEPYSYLNETTNIGN